MQIHKPIEGRAPLIFALILFLLCLCAYGYLFYSVQSGADRVTKTASLKENMELERERSLQFDIALRDNKQDIESLKELYIYENDTPKFIEKLETLANVTGVKMHLSSLTSNSDKKDASLAVSLEVDGKYQNIGRFIRSLELIPNYIVFNSISLNKAMNGSLSPNAGDGLNTPTSPKNGPVKSSDTWSAKISLSVLSYSAPSTKK